MEVIKIMLGDLQTNCYILVNDNKECTIIDPGSESEKVIELLELQGLALKGILITHGHFDHIGGVKGLQERYGVEIYAHNGESEMMANANLNLSKMFSGNPIECKASKFLKDGDRLELGEGFSFEVIEVPGHTSHSLCFLHSKGHMFTGDTLFAGGIGRTDLYDGSPRDLMVNIREKLFALDSNIKIYPGHGTSSTIGLEKETNPYFLR